MTSRSLVALLSCLIAAGTVRAADHLQCFKVKDSAAKTSYTADLLPTDLGFPVANGCRVRVPAKLLCVDVVKTNVSPTPPGAAPGLTTQKFLCYKTKCPKTQPTTTVQDQFGTHNILVKATSLLCAPVPVPTTTTTTASTTTSTIPSCTPTGPEVCDGVDNDCNGLVDDGLLPITCGIGQCQNTVPACVGGSPNTCTPNSPGMEVCDGIDNDCDGSVDEGLGTVTCGMGACQVTVPSCVMGHSNTCTPGSPSPEVCGNGIDDDCDGTTDEFPSCSCTTSSQCPNRPNSTPQCAASQCTFACNPGFADCNGAFADGCEANTQTDPMHCGSCGNLCNLPNATAGCSGGSCTVAFCAAGYSNCDNVAANGCEINVTSSPSNCGACGVVCPASNPNCVSSMCQ